MLGNRQKGVLKVKVKAKVNITKYYEYKDNPAKWEYKKFPVVLKNKKIKVIYDFYDFFNKATPITKNEFLKLKEEL